MGCGANSLRGPSAYDPSEPTFSRTSSKDRFLDPKVAWDESASTATPPPSASGSTLGSKAQREIDVSTPPCQATPNSLRMAALTSVSSGASTEASLPAAVSTGPAELGSKLVAPKTLFAALGDIRQNYTPSATPDVANTAQRVNIDAWRMLSRSRSSLISLVEDGEEDDGCRLSGGMCGGSLDESDDLWSGVQEVVLTYSNKPDDAERRIDSTEDSKDPRKGPTSALASFNGFGAGGSGDGLVGPPLNREAAYGMLLGWLRLRGKLNPPRRKVFDLQRLLNLKDHSLQFAELDGLIASPFDGTVALHRQIAFSVCVKFSKLSDRDMRMNSCSRYGPHWEAMGFQGDDFATDLRGVGILGLLHILSFFGSYPETARIALATNAERVVKHGTNGSVPLACASLNFSSLAILALREGRLSSLCRQAKTVHGALLNMHAALMVAFVHEFRSMPDATVLAFGEILRRLQVRIHSAPMKLLREFQEKVAPTERSTALRFALIRPLPAEEATSATDAQLPEDNGDNNVLARVRSSLRLTGDEQAIPTIEPQPTISPLRRASTRTPVDEVQAVFRMICRGSAPDMPLNELAATPSDLHFFLCDALGHGREEVDRFIHLVDVNKEGRVLFEEFHRGFRLLNSYRIYRREHERFLRKPGSIRGQQVGLEDLQGCEVHILDHVGCCTIDGCSACEVVVGPSESSVFIRDCEDCTFYVATQQLRTRRCVRCTLFLYSSTEPIIEMSSELRIAPLSLAYPRLATHLESAGLNPSRNFWNAVFDFSSPSDCRRNWKPVSLGECKQYRILIEDCPGDAMADADTAALPVVTEEMLMAPPLSSGLDVGRHIEQHIEAH